MSYGMPYVGSKNKIARSIISLLPPGKRFVDLFGGGGAMTHCAVLSGKYESVLYNEVLPLVADTFRKAIDGYYTRENFYPRWVSRDEFHAIKDKDGYAALCFSFGYDMETYFCSVEKEQKKKQGHEDYVLGKYLKRGGGGAKTRKRITGDRINRAACAACAVLSD